ncbi:unnamed protein product [Amoebophrya sp. A120]|nr:unnamed protein product [Amoebophrya sp. A120]|eukprot:GSA120T00021797001.1
MECSFSFSFCICLRSAAPNPPGYSNLLYNSRQPALITPSIRITKTITFTIASSTRSQSCHLKTVWFYFFFMHARAPSGDFRSRRRNFLEFGSQEDEPREEEPARIA